MATIDDVYDKVLDVLDKVADNLEKIGEVEDKLDNLVLHSKCSVCQGTGEVNDPIDGEPGPPYSCPQCSGDGTVKFGGIDTTIDTEAYE